MPLGPDAGRARAARARLAGLRDVVAAAEDDVLGCLVVTGEPGPQRALDDWLDQVADTLRAVGEGADEVRSGIPDPGPAPADTDAHTDTHTGARRPSRPVDR